MLNSNVSLDLKEESGIPYWKARGADTWNPFKKEGMFYSNMPTIYASEPCVGNYTSGSSTSRTATIKCPRSGAVTIWYISRKNDGTTPISNTQGIQGLVTEGAADFKEVKTTVTAGEELSIKTTVGGYVSYCLWFYMIYDDEMFDNEMHRSNLAHKAYSTNSETGNSIKSTASLTAPKSGKVVLGYFAMKRNSSNVNSASGKGLQGLVTAGALNLTLVETTVSANELLELTVTGHFYAGSMAFFFIIYK